jgi:aminoglycoside phosphotransferase (APT) family kinase protein
MTETPDESTPTARLREWMKERGLEVRGTIRLELIAGGRSNLTYRLRDDTGCSYVLRRPPLAHVLESAHDVGREHRIVGALAATRIPVPTSFGLCTDSSVIGAPFYVMNLVPGVVLATDDDGAGYPLRARGTASANLVDVLADIHLVDVDAVGLGTLGRKESYCERQLRRWRRQFHSSADRDVPLIDEIHDRLAMSIPPQRFTGLVHGDYRPGNTLLSHEGTVNAVLDWELATLGDTLADLGWMLSSWREPNEADLLASPTGHEGWFSRSQLIERYQTSTGHDVSDIGWYTAFALWRRACIGEGIYARHLAGAMGDVDFDVEAQGRLVIRLAESAKNTLDAAL